MIRDFFSAVFFGLLAIFMYKLLTHEIKYKYTCTAYASDGSKLYTFSCSHPGDVHHFVTENGEHGYTMDGKSYHLGLYVD